MIDRQLAIFIDECMPFSISGLLSSRETYIGPRALSEFCPDICPWDDIAVALPVFMYGQN